MGAHNNLLTPDEIRLHGFLMHRRTDRVSFYLTCTGCDWRSTQLWDDEDMSNAKRRHLGTINDARRKDLDKMLRRERESYTPPTRKQTGSRRSDGQTQRSKAEAGIGEAVQGGGSQRETIGSEKPKRRRRRRRAKEVRQEADGQDGRQGTEAGHEETQASVDAGVLVMRTGDGD